MTYREHRDFFESGVHPAVGGQHRDYKTQLRPYHPFPIPLHFSPHSLFQGRGTPEGYVNNLR